VIIRNFAQIATTPLRRAALEIVEAGIEAVLPSNVFADVKYDPAERIFCVGGKEYPLNGRVFVVGGGKGAGAMAQALESLLADRIVDGLVTCKGSDYSTRKIKVLPAGHPVPDERGLRAVREMLDLRGKWTIGRDDTVICLLSGGGSALLPCPAEGISLRHKQAVTGLLLASGADINEINTVRKHLSCVKGGELGRHFAPAKVISVIISDVIGNDLSVIASGPTSPDPTTFADALSVLRKYRLTEKAPAAVLDWLNKGVAGLLPETPKRLDNCSNHIIADSRLALEAMRDKAEALDFRPILVDEPLRGEPGAASRQISRDIKAGKYRGHDAVILGGETTPVLPENHGQGGRNQHFAAASILEMEGYPGDWVLASVGTDGSDFLPEVAGAIVDRNASKEAADAGLDVRAYLRRFDSNGLLGRLGNSLIATGDTGTNVGDVVVYLLR
jgi:hydroxypyruvate reductase/glycerate 2-kinase